MLDKRINYKLISDTFGCDTCKHQDDGMWDDYCRICNPDYYPTSKYRPVRGSIQEKVYYDDCEKITYKEYLRFIAGSN